MEISIDMKELSTFIGKLNALLEFIKVFEFARITYIYWPIDYTSRA